MGRTYDLQGHRGARGLRPENTLPAFEVALDIGVTTLELDLHFTADDRVVVWHDPAIDPAKCSGGDPRADEGPTVRSLTAAQLGAYRCDRNPDPDRFPDQVAMPTALAGDAFQIVTLQELFAFVAAYAESPDKSEAQRANAAAVQFNIETKRRPDEPGAIGDGFDGTNPGPFELAILDDVAAAGVADRVTIQSFDHRSLWAIRSVDADASLAALTRRNELPDFAELAAAGAEIWSPDFSMVGAGSLESAREAGLEVIPWTVNDPDDMQRLLDLGVEGIITDRPDLAP